MKISNLKSSIKIYVVYTALLVLFFVTGNDVSYALTPTPGCPPNVVPNPLDPNCQLQAGGLTLGSLINRPVGFLPYLVTILAVGSLVWGSLVLMFAQDEDGKKKAIRIFTYTIAGLIAFSSIWLILFIVSVITGVDLLKAIGQ